MVYAADAVFVVPDDVIHVTVEAWGAGGGGGKHATTCRAVCTCGQCHTPPNRVAGGGGGGGGYARGTVSVIPGEEIVITVGTGGNAGEAGGDSWFGSPDLVKAAGGEGGGAGPHGGAGGHTNLGNEAVFAGGSGGSGGHTGPQGNRTGGGGGGSAFPAAPGQDGMDGGNNAGGEGGDGPGSGGHGRKGGQDGRTGVTPGGGGGGGGQNGIGGPGADGRVIISYTPLPMFANVSAVPGPNQHTEIELTWDSPLQAAGLDRDGRSSPDTFAVYYTREDRDPDSDDSFVRASAERTHERDAQMYRAVLSNFVHGATYRLALASLDDDGNPGPLSPSASVTLPEVRMLQGMAQNGRVKISWDALPDHAYDLIVAEADDFSSDLNHHWTLAASGVTNRFVCTDPVPGDTLRFYRVAPAGAWTPDRPARSATRDVYVARSIRLYPGQNWIQFPGIPDDPTVASIFGVNTLPAGATPARSVNIYWYKRAAGPLSLNKAVWLTDGFPTNTWFTLADFRPVNDMIVSMEDAAVIRAPSQAEPGSLRFVFVGRVPTNSFSQTIAGGSTSSSHDGRSLVQYQLPRRMHPGELNLLESGFEGGADMSLSDLILTSNQGTTAGYMKLWFNTAEQTWYEGDRALPADAKPLLPDRGMMIVRRSGRPDHTWTRPVPYPAPTRDMNP